MKFLVIKTSNLTNILIIVVSLAISAFSFLFGIANLINPDVVSDEYLFQNTVVCLVLCGIGVSFLLLATASFRGILYKNKVGGSKLNGK